MKNIFLFLLTLYTYSIDAQEPIKTINSSIAMSDFIIDNKQTETIIKTYGADYNAKLRTQISEMNAYTHSLNQIESSGAIIGIVNCYLALIVNNRSINTEKSKTEILSDLLLLKAIFNSALAIEETNFQKLQKEKQFSNLKNSYCISYESTDKKWVYSLNGYYTYFLTLFRFYYTENNEQYLDCLNRTLALFVNMRESSKKKNEQLYKRESYYNKTYLNQLSEKYDITKDLIKQVDKQAYNTEVKEELKALLLGYLPNFDVASLKRKFDSVESLAETFEAMASHYDISIENALPFYYFPEAFTCLNLFSNKYQEFLLKKEGVKPELKLWFEKTRIYYANKFVVIFNETIANQKIKADVFDPFLMYNGYDPIQTLSKINIYGAEFDKKYIPSLITALKYSFTSYKTWRELDLPLFYKLLVPTVESLGNYYEKNKDAIRLAKVKNCLTVLKEEKTVKAGEVKDAIDAL